MSKNKSKDKSGAKMPYFKAIHEQMLADESKEFWELAPVENTLIGRTVSHVIFRTVGVDIAKYLASRLESGNEMSSLTESRTPDEVAEMEFLSAWNNLNQSYATLQLEAIAFRALINCRDYQLWLAETLSKIPLTQWEKVRARFTQTSGNPVYIAGYNTWIDALRNRLNPESKIAWLPHSEMTSLEKYVISRTVKHYHIDEELQARIDEWRKQAKKHGYLSMSLTQGRVNAVYNSAKALGYVDFGLTDVGLEYYEHAVVLWGLWADSIPELVPEDADNKKVMASLANSLVNNFSVELYGRLRSSFFNEWSNRHRVQFEEIEEKRTSKKIQQLEEENARLQNELRASQSRLTAAEKEIKSLKESNKELEASRDCYKEKCDELADSLKKAEKKLAKVAEKAKSNSEAKNGATATPQQVTALEKKVAELEFGLKTVTTKLDDLYVLLSAEDTDDDIESKAEAYENTDSLTALFEGAAKELAENSRVIINGGAKTWQTRVRKWFEDQGVKVRTYELGDCVSGIRPTDVVLLNVIQNKHKYSMKFMDDVRSIGAKLVVCNVNNVEQTLRIVFGHPERKKC
jgi:hypothetical protein